MQKATADSGSLVTRRDPAYGSTQRRFAERHAPSPSPQQRFVPIRANRSQALRLDVACGHCRFRNSSNQRRSIYRIPNNFVRGASGVQGISLPFDWPSSRIDDTKSVCWLRAICHFLPVHACQTRAVAIGIRSCPARAHLPHASGVPVTRGQYKTPQRLTRWGVSLPFLHCAVSAEQLYRANNR